jgi:hypothetical protein
MKSKGVTAVGTTRTILILAGTLMTLMVGPLSAATAECTEADVQKMRDIMSPEDIERVCGRADDPNSSDNGENMEAARGEFDDCRRRLDEVVGEHYDLMHQIDERYLDGRDLEIYDREKRTIWGSSDRVYDIRDCEQTIHQYESVNRQLQNIVSRQQGGEEKYDECITKLEALRDEMAKNDIQSPSGRPETLELCEREYAYEKDIYRAGIMRQKMRQKNR